MSNRSRLVVALVIAAAAIAVAPAASATIPGDGGGSCAATIYAPVISFGYIQARGDVPCNSPYNWKICPEYLNLFSGWQTVTPVGCRTSGVPFTVGYPARYASSYFVSMACRGISASYRTFFQWEYQYDSIRWGYSQPRTLSC